MGLKRPLFLTHRWLGIGLGVLFVLWFVSGVVMMYVGFPSLTEEERLAGLAPLELTSVQVQPHEALAISGTEGLPRRLRLTMVLDRPAYHILPWGASWITVFADTGERIQGLSPEQAVAVAARFRPGESPAHAGLRALDQWTVSGSLHPYRPLHRVRMNDAQGTELYVSALTGEVVRDTHRAERGWNWIGANTHWIYPLALRRHPELWRYSVIVLSALGTVLALTGIVAGVLRLRLRRRYRNGRRSPYTGIGRWHHILGLACAFFVFTWIASGLLSLNPGKVFSSKSPDRQAFLAWTGGGLDLQRFALAPVRAWQAAAQALVPRELEWSQVNGQPYYVFRAGPQASVAVPASSGPARALAAIPADLLARAAAALLPGFSGELVRLEADDAYYYSHHQRRPLPALRVRFSDPAETWFHIDPATGTLIERLDRSNRVQRWLYNGLHSLDFAFLLRHRPAWDVLVIGLALGGLALSLTGVVIGWRRIAGRRSSRISAPQSALVSDTRRIPFEQHHRDDLWSHGKGVRLAFLMLVAGLHAAALWAARAYAPPRTALETTASHSHIMSLVELQPKPAPRVEESPGPKPVEIKPKPRPEPPVKAPEPPVQKPVAKAPEPPPAQKPVAKAPEPPPMDPTPEQTPLAEAPERPRIETPPAPPPSVPPRFDPTYLSNPSPQYPERSRQLGEEGRVVLRVRVSAKGLPAQIEVRRSSGFERLDEAAVGTVSRWKFVPARQGQTPIEAWVLIPISFTLSRG